MALESLDYMGERRSVGFFFLVLLVNAGGKVSLDSLALEDLALFYPKASSSPCLLHFNGTSSFSLSSSLLSTYLTSS